MRHGGNGINSHRLHLRNTPWPTDWRMQIEALTDSYSIFSYLAVARLQLPAEKPTYYNLAYLREKLVSGLISSYNWTDTRDMVADGLTKGSADRITLSAIMGGIYELHHAAHEYREPGSSASTDRRVSFDPDVSVSEPTYVWATAALSSELCATGGGSAFGTSAAAALKGGSSITTSWFSESGHSSSDHSRDVLWTSAD